MTETTTTTIRDDGRQNIFYEAMDEAHVNMGFFTEQLSLDVWRDKYAQKGERDFRDTAERVVRGIYQDDPGPHMIDTYDALTAGLWMPAGRILAGAGTTKRVTLMNCYVTGTIHDSMEGIMREHTNFALTMQQGGGDGADFSTIRPEGAILKRTGTKASGPMPFMDMWNSMCTTIRSAGDRRGAMMGVLADTHPDLPKFIVAKREKGRLTNFNISVLVSDAFMEAVREDEDWVLYFNVEPWEREPHLEEYDFVDDNGVYQYVYSVWKARDLWRLITENTYEWSEPGVIFIDRINEANNLWYCETIRCTNPCGEQPLPPHGACDLGHVNLARMVLKPFTEDASFNFDLLRRIVRIGVRFLDNVIDVTNYPLKEQAEEQQNKRRIGLGFTGLADAMAQLRLRYGNIKSADFAEKVQQVIAEETYLASIDLAIERGSFPLFDADKYLSGSSFAATKLPQAIKDKIRKHGIRNGVLNTIAPTGTTSCVYGNVSGGLEPIFAHFTQRNVLQADGKSWKPYREWGYTARLYRYIHGESSELPSYMVTADDLTINDHLLVQGRVQRWCDASISKTLNIPREMPYDEFVRVYDLAYNAGCKGATTYRPSDVRGAVLEKAGDNGGGAVDVQAVDTEQLRDRPEVLNGRTYKIKWPNREAALYLTINSDEDGRPFEVFITSKDGTYSEWTTALSLMITAIFRKGGDVSFIPYELKQIQSMRDGAFINKRYVGSLPAYIGQIIEAHLNNAIPSQVDKIEEVPQAVVAAAAIDGPTGGGDTCPSCYAPSLYYMEGCKKCTNCGFSECG
jgi:ribonucleoside-diphosphate reductase alpha chain